MNKDKIICAIIAFLVTTVLYGIGWLVTCGLIKLLSICFGFVFTWKLATGIWIVCLLLRWIVSAAKPKEK